MGEQEHLAPVQMGNVSWCQIAPVGGKGLQ